MKKKQFTSHLMSWFFGLLFSSIFVLGSIFYLLSSKPLITKRISFEEFGRVIESDELVSRTLSRSQLEGLKKVFEQNSEYRELNTLVLPLDRGRGVQKYIYKIFKIPSVETADFKSSDITVIPARNRFLKNAEYKIQIFQANRDAKIHLYVEKFCCENRFMAVANRHGWLKIQ